MLVHSRVYSMRLCDRALARHWDAVIAFGLTMCAMLNNFIFSVYVITHAHIYYIFRFVCSNVSNVW